MREYAWAPILSHTTAANAHPLDAYAALAESANVVLQAQEAAAALSGLARDLQTVTDQTLVERALLVGRKLATTEVVETLLAAAEQPWADPATLAGALRFRGPSVVGVVLGRLNAASDRSARRPYFQLAVALACFRELRESLVGSLEAALGDRRPEVVRNAIAVLAALGQPLPADCFQGLAAFPDVQVRLAFAQVVGRYKPRVDLLDLLCMLMGDEYAGVRLAAALALRTYNHPRAREALARCARTERDAETRSVCEGALRRPAAAGR